MVIPKLFEGKGADDDGARLGAGLRHRRGGLFDRASCCASTWTGCESLPQVQIFATDIDEAALAVARAGALSGELARRGHARAAGALLRPRRRHLSRGQGSARYVHLLGAQRDPRPAVLAARPDLLPQPADLPEARRCRAQVIPLFHYRAAAGRLSVPRHVRRTLRVTATCSPPSTRRTASSGAATWFARPSCRSAVPAARAAGHSHVGAPAGRLPQRSDLLQQGGQHRRRAFCAGLCHRQREPARSLYFSAGTGKYLQAAAGPPTRDIVAMARPGSARRICGRHCCTAPSNPDGGSCLASASCVQMDGGVADDQPRGRADQGRQRDRSTGSCFIDRGPIAERRARR